MRSDVAALYVDRLGPYPKLVSDWYDEARDARSYDGPLPIVAHPPCGPWSSLRHLHSKPEQRDLGIFAVEQVRKWGGVLEQPAGSLLFDECDMHQTSGSYNDFSLAVEQVAWGHCARKRTWLYLVGIDRSLATSGIRTGGTPTHWASGGRRHSRKGSGGFVPPGIKVCSAQQRNRTPIAFAEWLIELASTARVAGNDGEGR